MPVSDNAQVALTKASEATDIEFAVVVGKGSDGKIQLFLADSDKEKLIVLLERARDKLIRSLD